MTDIPQRLAVELHGVQLGSPAPAIVLGPAIGTTAAMWHPLLPYLTDDARVVIYSPRGHGGSIAPPGPYTLAELATDVVEVMETCGLETAHQVGDSLGGMVAMELAARHPERVESLTLIATSAHPGREQFWRERAADVRANGMAAQAETAVQSWFTPEFIDDPEARSAQQMLLSVDPEGYAGCCEALAKLDLRPDLPGIDRPTLVIAGADDEALPLEHSQVIAEQIPGARLEIVRHAAHLPPTQKPREVATLLRKFLGLPPLQ